jgi:lysophospholipid acyltransferase (LPLAT)-like uncharacterized protein
VVRVGMRRSIHLKWRWDNYELPLPFSHAVITLSDPFHVENDDEAMARVGRFLTGHVEAASEPCPA